MAERAAGDVGLLGPPLALWGYNVSATEEALGVIARSVTARDVEIATLRRELDELRAWWGPEKGACPAVPSGGPTGCCAVPGDWEPRATSPTTTRSEASRYAARRAPSGALRPRPS